MSYSEGYAADKKECYSEEYSHKEGYGEGYADEKKEGYAEEYGYKEG